MKITIIRDTETLRYSAEELAKYLRMMMPGTECEITVGAYDPDAMNLGLLGDYGISDEGVRDVMIDDLIDVNIKALKGYFAGSNERSVLMGVYNFFKSVGCRFIRPGALGDYVPKKDITDATFVYRKLADYPFRGECCEGAISFEHMADTITWLPKVNMNLFMLEQIVPYNYMNRWYRHTDNTKLPHDDIPYSDYVEYCSRIEKLVKKCGLQLHTLGHGALNEPFGVRHMISGQHYDVPEETKKAFALVKGKRELYLSSPFFTQMCMSQQWVQDKIVNWLVGYLTERPHIDFLHFWLADASNNHCECEECVKHHPSDLYVQMLNKLDAKLTEIGNNTKIVFIIYVDTLWPPIVEKLNNPSRFIMTAACGTGAGYSDKRAKGGIPKWERNNFTLPESGLPMALTFIDGWKRVFDGPRFIYEYYLYTAHYADPGYMAFSRQIARDVKTLNVTGFNGIMSDQTQRSFFPTGLPNTVIGEFQFDTSLDIEPFVDKYIADSFGEDYKLAKEYLDKISEIFDIKALTLHTDITSQDTGSEDFVKKKAGIIGNERVGDIIATAPDVVDSFAPTVAKNLDNPDPCHRESWRLLTFHGEYVKRLSGIYFALSRNDQSKANELLSEMMDYLSEVEPEIHPYFDLVLFKQRTRQLIAGK